MRTISNFPHLTVEEFAQGCEQLAGMISSPTLARSGLTASVIKDPLVPSCAIINQIRQS